MKRFFHPASLLPLAACGCLLFLSSCAAGPAVTPTAYEPFVASDKSFSGSGPAGWQKQESDIGGTMAKVEFTSGDGDIYIVSDTAASFMGDALKIGAKPPVEIVHERGLNTMSESMQGFSPQTMRTVQSPVGPARYSEFTAGDIHGYRATMMGPERAITIICKCSEAEWPALKPAFFKVFAELKPGAV